MSTTSFFQGFLVSSVLSWTYCQLHTVQPTSFPDFSNISSAPQLVRVQLSKTSVERSGSIIPASKDYLIPEHVTEEQIVLKQKRRAPLVKRQTNESNESSFQKDEVGWSNINAEVDMVVPMVLAHLQKLGIEHLQLPDMKESLTLNPLFITYEAGLYLSNGVVYNIAGISRIGDAFMTYEDKSFLCRFNLIIKSLQFEYDFLLKLMALEGYGKVIGSLDDTIIYGDLSISVHDTRLKLNDFRIMRFGNIRVQLDQRRIIRQLTGVILSPITNFFRDRITTSISDGLKDQMQLVMDDFNDKDPLELRKFTKQLLSGLMGDQK